MKSLHAKSGPLKNRPYYKNNEVEEMCLEALKASNLLPDEPAPIRIDRLIEKRFGINVGYQQLPDELLGFTRFGSKGVEEIIVAQALDEEGTVVANRRLRTTLAHEVGHGLLHAHLFVLEKKSRNLFGDSHDETPRVLCRDVKGVEGKNTYRGDWWEYQANLAMSALLLPRILVEKAIKPFLETPGLLGGYVLPENRREDAIKSLSGIFDVNPIVVRIRLIELFPLTNSRQLSL